MLAAEAEGLNSMLSAEAESAEAESMLGSEAEGELESEEESDGESDWEAVQKAEQWICRFRHCLCCWTSFPSGAERRVAPGKDYVCLPDTAYNHLTAWSLLVGVSDKASSSLRMSRLRVARSGRILGRSDDALDVFHDIRLAKPPGYSFNAAVAPLASDDSSLCLLTHTIQEQPQALQLTLQPQPQADTKELPLPEIEGTTSLCMPISADGHIWALSATEQANGKSFSVVAQRLVSVSGGGRRWELVGRPFTGPRIHYPLPPWRGTLIQGYAVIPDAKLILVSLQQYGLFFTFAPGSGSWTRVLTDIDEIRSHRYLPIVGRGIYVEQHKAVYILRNNIIYAYKLTYQKDDQGGTQQLRLDLPVKIDYVCPFHSEQGYGLLTRLSSRLMCAVWISLARYEPCPCEYLHAFVTTFHIHDTQDPAQRGIKALHSTYRRIDMKPIRPDPPGEQQFCFLQEYEDQGSLVLQQSGEEQEGLSSSQHGEVPSKMLSCCRNRLGTPGRYKCGKNVGLSLPVEPASSCPVVPLKGATTTIKKDLFIICQAGSRSVIYQTGAMDDVKPLELCHVADVGGSDCHFYQNGSKIDAVSSIRGGMLEFSLNKDRQTFERPVRCPNAAPFVMVTRVGRETIALTETLQVYHQTQFNYGYSTSWLRYTADGSDVASRRVDITGYVAVSDDSFIVCDAVTCSCLQFDLGAKQWSVVMPLAAFEKDPPTPVRTKGLLNGRCVFVDGFIYTCREGGLAAYELLCEDCCVYLSKPIFLPLSQSAHCVGEDMCLDYAGKDVDSGATLFYVVQGGNSPHKYGVWTATFSIATVKVKTERIASNKMKPVGIDNMDSVMRVIDHAEAMDTRCCFAV